MSGNEFRFFLSCDINLPVTFSIEKLEGNLPPINSPNSGTFFFFFFFDNSFNFPFYANLIIIIIHLCDLNFALPSNLKLI